MTGTLRVRRSRGALSGVLLVLLGIWGALIPFVGPYFHYAYTPDRAWDYTAGRLWLELLPGLAVLVGGALVLASRLRPVAAFGAWLAAAGGAWFAVGGLVARRWTTLPGAGTPVGGSTRMVAGATGLLHRTWSRGHVPGRPGNGQADRDRGARRRGCPCGGGRACCGRPW